MFSKPQEQVLFADLSSEVRDPQDWKVGRLRSFEFPLNITCLAIEPTTGLLAAGTAGGVLYLYGAPGVNLRLAVPEPVALKQSLFSALTNQVLCLDDKSQLHVWDLSAFGKPKHMSSSRFDDVISITLSPAHSHVFLALQNGEIKTYDLLCLRKSRYTIPNMWMLYEDKMSASGVPVMYQPAFNSHSCVEVVIHPRNLNLLLVAYVGGVVLFDLTERNTVYTYELILPPGAPGGTGYQIDDILQHRRPSVTAIAFHPSGHVFAVGYSDGCIAFWALEDDSHPLVVRTLERTGVNLVNAMELESFLGPTHNDVARVLKEPIFKMSWSGYTPTSGSTSKHMNTTLTILGGFNIGLGEASGLSVLLLPAIDAGVPPTEETVVPGILSQSLRKALSESLIELDMFIYDSPGVIQDYLLIPRISPHYSGTFDPYAILSLVELSKNQRSPEAIQYPPSHFALVSKESINPVLSNQFTLESTSGDNIAQMQMMDAVAKSRHLSLPFGFANGSSRLLNGQILKLEKEQYLALIGQGASSNEQLELDLKGGRAWPGETKLNELKLSKFQPHRILVTHYQDLSVQFFDLSAQLLIPPPSTPIENNFPELIPSLTLHLKLALMEIAISNKLPDFSDATVIQSVHFATEALECAIVLDTGEVVVCRSPTAEIKQGGIPRDSEIIELQHSRSQPGCKLAPSFLLMTGRGNATTCAITDSGFMAVAYKDGSLFAVDLRGPNIILRSTDKIPKKRHSMGLPSRHHADTSVDPVGSMAWTISGLEKDTRLSVRLVVNRYSGLVEIYNLGHSGNPASWNIIGEPISSKGVVDPLPNGSFVLDGKTGFQQRADKQRLATLYHPTESSARQVFLTVGVKGARCIAEINGNRIGKADWGHKLSFAHGAQIVEKLGSHALVVWGETQTALVYSLPQLEYLHTLQLLPIPSGSLPLSVDESGDFMLWTQYPNSNCVHSAVYGTFFDIRRVYDDPKIEFPPIKDLIPPHPQPVSLGPTSVLGSWFNFQSTLSGAQIDALLGGPDRPIPQSKNSPSLGTTSIASTTTTAQLSPSSLATNVAASASAAQATLYGKLTSAIGERGQLLGDLEERFNSLEEGSRGMVAQAKRLAAQQTAKGWFTR